ncbi:26S proteasome non-ATPase regulatory subunit 9 [Xylona heveae TC161]|uniref:Probable 26S proteasome regulatory subunit p27 n=1 Tax=Xylona heveae (strain CBS 132557 / TC161) TaxID=1328760 RepID=A0A161TPR3_XYLHT|nr:26S proteasome non-ATPase regulatory subunit 9 [Xylona heveae TC161]KZF24236.1 26S proteasome non-ATPase regulatory subunit 9 [Xylona heveae TC161]
MGLPMDDIHAPTVTSGPTTSGSGVANGSNLEHLSLMELIAEKDKVEEELKALGSVLDSHNVNMNTSLTTFDGYPRADIDVAQIRTTRARIIRLRNDFKNLMSKIETGLHSHYSAAAAAAAAATSQPPATHHEGPTVGGASTASSVPGSVNAASASGLIETPFAKVNSVVEGSPADEAGLKAGDRVRRFGTATWLNHEKLTKVAEVVRQNEGRPIQVKIVRKNPMTQADQELLLHLTPRSGWGGRGLLGCHLVPA